jgi:hypothetical protein
MILMTLATVACHGSEVGCCLGHTTIYIYIYILGWKFDVVMVRSHLAIVGGKSLRLRKSQENYSRLWLSMARRGLEDGCCLGLIYIYIKDLALSTLHEARARPRFGRSVFGPIRKIEALCGAPWCSEGVPW